MNKFNTFIEDVRSEFKWKGFLTVIGAFLFSLSIVGLHGVVKNQFTLPVAEALGVGKAAVSSWDSFAKASGIVTAALIGTIYKKLGPRWLAIVAGLTVCLGYVIVATTNSLNLFYAAGFLIGIGQASAGGLMFFTIVKPWWNRAFGTFAALCGTASGIGGVLFVTTVTKSITEGGYQAGAWKVAILTIILSVVGGLLMSESPNDALRNQAKAEKEAKARGEVINKEKKKVSDTGVPALGYADFLKTPITYIIFLMMIMSTFNVATSLFSPMAEWKGYAEPNVVGGAALTAYSFLLIWTKLGAGTLRDSMGMKIVLPIMYIPAITCICLNLFTTLSSNMYTYVCALMAFSGTATQLLVGFVSIQAFGKYFNTKVHGMTVAVFSAAGIVIPPLRHLPYDLTGSYSITLIVMLAFAILSWILAIIAINMGRRYQAKLDADFEIEKASVS
jgi:MFS family permease